MAGVCESWADRRDTRRPSPYPYSSAVCTRPPAVLARRPRVPRRTTTATRLPRSEGGTTHPRSRPRRGPGTAKSPVKRSASSTTRVRRRVPRWPVVPEHRPRPAGGDVGEGVSVRTSSPYVLGTPEPASSISTIKMLGRRPARDSAARAAHTPIPASVRPAVLADGVGGNGSTSWRRDRSHADDSDRRSAMGLPPAPKPRASLGSRCSGSTL